MSLLVWINGTFGAGKTTVAAALAELDPTLRRFDPEEVGFMLRNLLPDQTFSNFQQLPSWRRLTPIVAHDIAEEFDQTLIVVQAVLDPEYWSELVERCAAQGDHVRMVLLDADPHTMRTRIHADPVEHRALDWRLEHLPTYFEQRAWLLPASDLHLDTTDLTPQQSAVQIIDAIVQWIKEDSDSSTEGGQR